MNPWPKKARRSKFGAVRTGDFPSKLEASVYQQLGLREKAGEIRNIQRQASVRLHGRIRWKVDFSFELCATGETVWCEAKGKWTGEARKNLNLWRDGLGPGKLEIWQGSYTRPVLVETVVPKLPKLESEICPLCKTKLGAS